MHKILSLLLLSLSFAAQCIAQAHVKAYTSAKQLQENTPEIVEEIEIKTRNAYQKKWTGDKRINTKFIAMEYDDSLYVNSYKLIGVKAGYLYAQLRTKSYIYFLGPEGKIPGIHPHSRSGNEVIGTASFLGGFISGAIAAAAYASLDATLREYHDYVYDLEKDMVIVLNKATMRRYIKEATDADFVEFITHLLQLREEEENSAYNTEND